MVYKSKSCIKNLANGVREAFDKISEHDNQSLHGGFH